MFSPASILRLHQIVLLVLSQAAVVASARCSVSWDLGCDTDGWVTSTVTLLVTDDDAPEYDAAVVFHWGATPDTDLGTRTYITEEEAEITQSHQYETGGGYREYYIGYSLTLQELCKGKTFRNHKLVWFDDELGCDFEDADSSTVPTRAVSDPPTKFPTNEPTPPPSKMPTSRPTTDSPSTRPTVRPSMRPSSPPSKQPTERPTKEPTVRPTTDSPSKRPTDAPSIATPRPSKRPTRRPTRVPTMRPTTPVPSRQPTDAPSRQPSNRPSPPPSERPALRPTTSSPSKRPKITSLPSGNPTHRPSASGTNFPLLYTYEPTRGYIDEAGSEKTLRPTAATTRPATIAINAPNTPAVASQPNGTNSPTDNSPGMAGAPPLPTTSAPVAVPRNDAPSTAPLAEDKPLRIDGTVGAVEGTTEGNSNTAYIIIASVAGGACILLLAVIIGRYFATRNNSTDSKQTKQTLTTSHNHPQLEAGLESETKSETLNQPVFAIEPNDVDDVSTLGDPYVGDAAPAMNTDNTVGESMVSSQEKRYVYGVRTPRGMGASLIGESTANSGSNFHSLAFGEDTTLEDLYRTPDGSNDPAFQRFTVVAPPGQLGMVLDNGNGDVPMVWAIKGTSALHGKVRVGDMLLSVDGVDCRGMSTQEVSTFLSGRSRNPLRTLLLARSLEKASGMVGV